MKRLLLCLALIAAAVGVGHTQQQAPSNFTQVQTVKVAYNDAAVNNAVTVTIPGVSGKCIFYTGADLSVSNDATGGVVSTNAAFTSTNLSGWKYVFSQPGTANTQFDHQVFLLYPMQSVTPGLAVTIVSPAANAHVVYSIAVYYFIGICTP